MFWKPIVIYEHIDNSVRFENLIYGLKYKYCMRKPHTQKPKPSKRARFAVWIMSLSGGAIIQAIIERLIAVILD